MIQVYNVSYSGDRFGMIVANLSKKNLGRPYIKKKKNKQAGCGGVYSNPSCAGGKSRRIIF
jgi:hypothetical protein